MNAFEMTDKWHEGTLTRGEICIYLEKNVAPMDRYHMTSDMTVHVVDCCYEIYRWAKGEIAFLDGALEEIVKNDLRGALTYAGPLLRHGGLWAIHIFLYNVAPVGWEKRKQTDPQA